MGFFQNIRNALIRFMYGRNGMDHLNRALFGVFLAVYLGGAILGRNEILGTVFYLLQVAVSVTLLYRTFSRDLGKRRAENQKFVNWWWSIKNKSDGAKQRHADKDHKYFTCKNCGAICRVPVGKGKIVITCPKCGGEIHAKT